jgi:AraC-like DNA-binding protein
MSSYNERTSSHQYVEATWRNTSDGSDYWVPADGCWDIIFARQPESMRIFVAGPMTKARLTRHADGTELFGIRFKSSICMPQLLPGTMVNDTVDLLYGSNRSSLWLGGVRYEIPTNETAELFVDRLCKNKVLSRDGVIDMALEGRAATLSSRSVQRHFVQTTGLTRKFIEQTKRAQLAKQLLESNEPAAKVALCAGYADQAHMTRSFKTLLGYTPSQLAHP